MGQLLLFFLTVIDYLFRWTRSQMKSPILIMIIGMPTMERTPNKLPLPPGFPSRRFASFTVVV